MKLYIDTTKREYLTIRLNEEEFTTSKNSTSQILLPFIIEKLKEKGKSLKDITLVEINQGPGSFTGLRVGASVALSLIWALNISAVQSIKLTY